MHDKQLTFTFEPEPKPIRLEAVSDTGGGLPIVTVWINGERFRKQVEHELSNGILAFGHNGFAYGVQNDGQGT